MPDKDQIFIFNAEELSLIKNTFADNDVLIHTIRKAFLQFPMTEVEKGLLKQTLTPEVIHVLKKRIKPELSPEFPLGQLSSLTTTLAEKLKVLSPEEMKPHLDAMVQIMDYIDQQFAVLEGGADESIKLSALGNLRDKSFVQQYVDINTYLFILGYIDPCLILIKTIAGTKTETPEQQTERMKRNSSK